MRADRIWMYNRRHHSRKGLNDEFVVGVDQFIGYVFSERNLGSNGQIRCPCLRCDNRKFIDVEIVKDHLYRHGFVPDYYQWIWHGEPFLHHDNIERVGVENDARVDVDNVERVVDVEVDEPNPYRTMILDAAGPNFDSNMNLEVHEPPNQDAQQFYDLLRAAEEPLYEGRTTHTLLWDAQLILLKKWDDPHAKKVSAINKKNRLSHGDGLGLSCHTGGSIPYSEHKRKYEEAIGKKPTPSELFLITHKCKKTGEFVDNKSKAILEKFESQMRELFGDTSIASEYNNDDDVDIVETTTKKELSIWTKVVGGPSKGRIYGLGSVASTVRVETTPSIPHMSSTTQENLQDVEKRIREKILQEMQKEMQDMKTQIMEQLLASYGMPILSPLSLPLDRSVGSVESTNLPNKDL